MLDFSPVSYRYPCWKCGIGDLLRLTARLWCAFTTESMAVGYASSLNPKPKVCETLPSPSYSSPPTNDSLVDTSDPTDWRARRVFASSLDEMTIIWDGAQGSSTIELLSNPISEHNLSDLMCDASIRTLSL